MTKPGIQTTEFWVSISPVLIGLFEHNKGNPELAKYFLICGSVLGIAYIISRTYIKVKKQK